VHLDLRCDDLDAELTRLRELGARVVARHQGLTVLADPEGNEFCLLH
jgi:predicted enzyme related to lactoylglutathione lyase